MIDKIKSVIAALTKPSTVIFAIGLLTVIGGTLDYLAEQDFVQQYGPVIAFLGGARLVIDGALKVVRLFLPTFGLRKRK